MIPGVPHPSMPHVVSVNVGRPREIADGDRVVRTAIFKSPADGTVRVGRLNLDGDGQADLKVHGGEAKAVYAYPAEHYGPWAEDLGRTDLGWGAFGENLTLRGLLERDVHEGDVLRIGSAAFVVTTPRQPCFKLALRLGTKDVVARMWETGRCGFYLSVAAEGEIRAGDAVALERGGGAVDIGTAFAHRRPGTRD